MNDITLKEVIKNNIECFCEYKVKRIKRKTLEKIENDLINSDDFNDILFNVISKYYKDRG